MERIFVTLLERHHLSPDSECASLTPAEAAFPECDTFLQGVQKKQSGTPLYVAPESFMQTSGLESDMWSLGMLFYQLLCGRLPFADSFKNKRAMEVMMAILSEDVTFEGPHWRLISEEARSLIMRMLDRDSNSRVRLAKN